MPQFLRDGSDHLNIDRFSEPGQLLERLGGVPGLSRSLDRDQQRLLGLSCGRDEFRFAVARFVFGLVFVINELIGEIVQFELVLVG
jgi:hypothetical protein